MISKELSDPSRRLVTAAARLLADRGRPGVSARAVAAEARLAASAINYNLGGLEQLLSTALEVGCEEAAAWLARCEPQVARLPATPDGAALALEAVILAWTGEARDLALLYQEAAGTEVGARWTGLWAEFWARTAERCGLGTVEGRLLHAAFESEALFQLSGWSPVLEAAALRELCGQFGALWLGASPGLVTGACRIAEEGAGARPEGSLAAPALRIADAAAEVVAEKGLAGLTHRAVAMRAGVTTGAVTHHFRTIEDLVAGAIRGQVSALSRVTPGGQAPATPDGFVDALFFHARADRPSIPVLSRRGLFLAAVRRPDLARAGAVIRFAHGGTTRDSLVRLFRVEADQGVVVAGVLARLLSALWSACAGQADPAEARAILAEAVIRRPLDRLGAR